MRVAFWLVIVGTPVMLLATDRWSRRPAPSKAGTRTVTVNVNERPERVAAALLPLNPDIVLMQETRSPCGPAASLLGLRAVDGSDQCLLSRWPMTPHRVSWKGPWQSPQLVTMADPGLGSLAVVNVRLAIPEAIAAVATLGGQWYTEAQRRDQFPELRRILGAASPAIVCGDFNALPLEVDLGPRMRDTWSGLGYGATFPALLPAARIDQCWVSPELEIAAAWTLAVPSDHRALVVDTRLRLGRPRGSGAGEEHAGTTIIAPQPSAE